MCRKGVKRAADVVACGGCWEGSSGEGVECWGSYVVERADQSGVNPFYNHAIAAIHVSFQR